MKVMSVCALLLDLFFLRNQYFTIILIKDYSKYIYNFTKDFCLNKCCTFEFFNCCTSLENTDITDSTFESVCVYIYFIFCMSVCTYITIVCIQQSFVNYFNIILLFFLSYSGLKEN